MSDSMLAAFDVLPTGVELKLKIDDPLMQQFRELAHAVSEVAPEGVLRSVVMTSLLASRDSCARFCRETPRTIPAPPPDSNDEPA